MTGSFTLTAETPPQIKPFYHGNLLSKDYLPDEYFETLYDTADTEEDKGRYAFLLMEFTPGKIKSKTKTAWFLTALEHESLQAFRLAGQEIMRYHHLMARDGYVEKSFFFDALTEAGCATHLPAAYEYWVKAAKKGEPDAAHHISMELLLTPKESALMWESCLAHHDIPVTASLPYRLSAIALYGGNADACRNHALASNKQKRHNHNPQLALKPFETSYNEWLAKLGHIPGTEKIYWDLLTMSALGRNEKSATECASHMRNGIPACKHNMSLALGRNGIPEDERIVPTFDKIADTHTAHISHLEIAYKEQQIALFHENAVARMQNHLNNQKPRTIERLLDFNCEL